MPYVERVTKAGNTIEIERYFTSRYKKKGISRGDKVKPTKEEQEKVNTRQAERKLRILINANYGYGDYHLVLVAEYGTSSHAARPYMTVANEKAHEKVVEAQRSIWESETGE
jgi:hypothetical protein